MALVLAQTVVKSMDSASHSPIPPSLSANFKFDDVFDGTVNYIEVFWTDGQNSDQFKQNDGENWNEILGKSFFEGEFFENAYWRTIIRYGMQNALCRISGMKINIAKELANSSSPTEPTLKIEFLREQKSEIFGSKQMNANFNANKATTLSSDSELLVRTLPKEAHQLLIKANTDLSAAKWLKIGPISESTDEGKTLLVEIGLYEKKEIESDEKLHEEMNALNENKNNEANCSSGSSEEDDLKLIVEPEQFSVTEAVFKKLGTISFSREISKNR